MHKTLLSAAALAAIAFGTPAVAGSSGDNAAPAAKTASEADTNKVVCRRVEAIGTRLSSKKVCRTKGEWDAEAAANRQDLERSQTQRWKSD
ncbi:MAG: hypothetical protein J0L50_03380 [Sphingomonadales bacterium]|nr:hypothetical protein [Sphingomonadales bacterium]